MTDKVIRIVIDSGPAEAGARRVVRSLEAIRDKSVEAAAGIDDLESSLKRLKELERGARSSLGEVAERSGSLGQGAGAALLEEAREVETGIQKLKGAVAEFVGFFATLEGFLELANSSESIRKALPVLEKLLKISRFATGAGGLALISLEIINFISNIKQLDGIDREFEAIIERVNKILREQTTVTSEEVKNVQESVREKIQKEIENLRQARQSLAETVSEKSRMASAYPGERGRGMGELMAGGQSATQIADEQEDIEEAKSKIQKLTTLLGLLGKLVDEIATRNQGMSAGDLGPGSALEGQTSQLEELQRELEATAEANRHRQERAAQVLLEIQTPLERYNEELTNLNELLAAGTINQDQFDRALGLAKQSLNEAQEETLRSSRELADGAKRAFQDYADAATNAAAQVEGLVTQGLGSMEDALVGFVKTGKLEWKSLVDSMIEDLIRLFIRSQILGPLAQGLGGVFGGGGAGGFLDTAATRTSVPGGIGGFAHGGSFTVPGSGGVDSVIPIFRATPGERVTVAPPGLGGGPMVNVNVINNAGAEVETRERPNGRGGVDIEVMIARAVERDINTGGRVAKSILGLTGARPALAGR